MIRIIESVVILKKTSNMVNGIYVVYTIIFSNPLETMVEGGICLMGICTFLGTIQGWCRMLIWGWYTVVVLFFLAIKHMGISLINDEWLVIRFCWLVYWGELHSKRWNNINQSV